MHRRFFFIFPFFIIIVTGCIFGYDKQYQALEAIERELKTIERELHELEKLPPPPSFREILDEWVGKDFTSFTNSHYGYSDSLTDNPSNGNKVYVYKRSKNISTSYSDYEKSEYIWVQGERVETKKGGYRSKEKTVNHQCSLYVEVDAQNIIKNIKSKGDGCWSSMFW